MSEDFLSRWSRRKSDAAVETKTATTPPGDAERADEGDTPAAEPQSPAMDATTKPAELPFDLASLPPIDSITAATDIRPFLARGVPAELARAALRRAWTADPAIRNFVGLADYAWDYHTPGSMAGFGPLEMTDELRRVVARIIGDLPAEIGTSAPRVPPDDVASAEKPSDVEADKGPSLITPPDPREPDPEPAASRDVARSSDAPASARDKHAAVQQEVSGYDISPSMVRRNHGGALPK
jgi:hypothetical protein